MTCEPAAASVGEPTAVAGGEVLLPPQWREREAAHQERVHPWVEPRLRRRREGQRHPVDDFLFEYYRLRPGRLLTWHPGWCFEVVAHPRLSDDPGYRKRGQGWGVDPSAVSRPQRLDRAIAVLQATAGRAPSFGCFGMHEWAMLYTTDAPRHGQVPLRVGARRIAETVESVGLRCSHFDAYRFFTAAARPLQQPLSRAGQADTEQPGCIHAGMDLYRYAYEALPLVSSELVADCFAHAHDARQVDMRASPYDLADWGLAPIAVDTAAGRREYLGEQRRLAARAEPLRRRLLAELESAVAWIARSRGATRATA
jgi:hypothetical protein